MGNQIILKNKKLKNNHSNNNSTENPKASGILRNLLHYRCYHKIIKNLSQEIKKTNPKNILDLGCGGAISVKIFLKKFKEIKVYATESSKALLALAKKRNKKAILNEKAILKEANVEKLPFKEEFFECVSVFDSIHYWKDTQKGFEEVFRVLKKGGLFIIVNAFAKDSNKLLNMVKFKDEHSYLKPLKALGFKNIYFDVKKSSITVFASKA